MNENEVAFPRVSSVTRLRQSVFAAMQPKRLFKNQYSTFFIHELRALPACVGGRANYKAEVKLTSCL